MGCKTLEVFTLVIRGTSGAFLGDCFGFLLRAGNPPSQWISTDHPNNLKKVKWTREKEEPSLPSCSKPTNRPFYLLRNQPSTGNGS
jgi:hypothetical protein